MSGDHCKRRESPTQGFTMLDPVVDNPQLAAGSTRRRITFWVSVVAGLVVGMLFWHSVDWTVYDSHYTQGTITREPQFELTEIEQAALSAIVGGCIALVFFLVLSLEIAVTYKAAYSIALAGAALSASLFYLVFRVGGDLYTTFLFNDLSSLDFLIVALVVLLISEGFAIVLGLLAWTSSK
jgi:hypothetical protein